MRHAQDTSIELGSLTEVSNREFETALRAVEEFRVKTSDEANLNTSAADVRRAIKARRDRTKFLPGHLFADPAWDMLLELYAAELDQIRFATSSLCDASAVPATTALRWISTLENEGLIERHSDPLDARRVFIRLSSKGVRGMKAYFGVAAGR